LWAKNKKQCTWLSATSLRNNSEQASRYEALKRGLAGEHEGKTLRSIDSYSLAKSEFIKNALERS
jgi:GrpB-like predicted nucleotidyltransferase (UPF0157 family)